MSLDNNRLVATQTYESSKAYVYINRNGTFESEDSFSTGVSGGFSGGTANQQVLAIQEDTIFYGREDYGGEYFNGRVFLYEPKKAPSWVNLAAIVILPRLQ